MAMFRYLEDVTQPRHLAGKKDARRDLPEDQAQHMLEAGMIVRVPTPAAETVEVVREPIPEPLADAGAVVDGSAGTEPTESTEATT